MRWTENDGQGRDFTVACAGRDVPGVLWAPQGGGPFPLVLAGHGFTVHKRALYPATLIKDLNSRGFALAAIDAPGHGERQPDGGRDTEASDRAWRAHWREHGASQIAEEWRATLDALLALPEIEEPVGYFGLSLGTQYGVGVLAAEPRIRAAVLGLSALPAPGPRIAAYASNVSCPVFFIQQRDDEIAPLDRSNALFAAIASADKTFRSSPGGHMDVPRAVFEEAYGFLERHLT